MLASPWALTNHLVTGVTPGRDPENRGIAERLVRVLSNQDRKASVPRSCGRQPAGRSVAQRRRPRRYWGVGERVASHLPQLHRRHWEAGLQPIGTAYWLAALGRRGKRALIGGGRRRRGRGLYKGCVAVAAQAVGLSERHGRGAPGSGQSWGWRGRERRLRGVQGGRPRGCAFLAEPGADLERLR